MRAISVAPSLPQPAKHSEVADYLRQKIRSQVLAVGNRLPSFTEMQEQFGVTPTTVNRALIQLEHEGLIVRERRRGVFVAERPKPLKTGTIGVSALGFTFPEYSAYWSALFAGIFEEAQKNQNQVLVLDHTSTQGWEKADGLIVHNQELLEELHPEVSGIACVSMFIPSPQISCVLTDDYGGMKAATEHLLALGHRRIGFLSRFRVGHRVMTLRRNAYLDALQAAGIEHQVEWERELVGECLYGRGFNNTARETMAIWLREGFAETSCTAILCQNDETALGAMSALNDAGWKVPNDVSLVGFDGTEICDYSSPRLTTVKVPLQNVGGAAVELLLAHIADAKRKIEGRLLPVELRIGDSTASPKGGA